ncbi:MAG: tetratricopeptide repeat protein [Polyangiaceae bacterium]
MATVLVVAGCSAGSTPPRQRSEPSASSASGAASTSAAASGTASAVDTTDKPVDYEQAISLGERALDREDFVEAFHLFRAALDARPGDPEARFGLGRVDLGAGMLHFAVPELKDVAVALPQGRERARALYALGLAYERQGLASEARDAFLQSQREAKSPEVDDKLVGRTACPARVDRTVRGLHLFRSWREAYEAWEGTPSTKTDEKLRAELLATSTCKESICLASGPYDWFNLLLPASGPSAFLSVGQSPRSRCGGGFGFEVELLGDVAHVRLLSTYVFAVPGADGFGWACPDDPGLPRDVDIFIDLPRHELFLLVDRMAQDLDHMPRLKVDANGITLPAPGCGPDVPLPDKATR